MDEEKLICLVSCHEFLFSVSTRVYSDKLVKMNAWERVSEEMGKSVSDCQKLWKSIRDNFRKAVNLRTNKSGGAAGGKSRPIRYEKKLEVLKPHLQLRQQTSNLDSSPEDTQTSFSCPSSLSLDNDSPRPSSQMSSYSQPKQNWGRPSDILEKYLQRKESEDPVDIFFKTMTTTVKRLPQKNQAETKKEVFKIVNDAELKFYAQHDIDPSPPLDVSRSSIKIPNTGYTVHNTEDTTYVPTTVARNTTPPQYTYTPSSLAPRTSFRFPESPLVEFITKSHTTKHKTSNTDNPTMQGYLTSIDTNNLYLLRETNYSTEDSDNALNF